MIVHYRLTGQSGTDAELQTLFALEDKVSAVVSARHVGEDDGNDVGLGEFTLYEYGPSAQALFDAIVTDLRACPIRPAYAVLEFGRTGDPHLRAQRINL